MTHEEIKARFEHEIDLRGVDDKWIDRNEEREILQIALLMGLGAETSHQVLAAVCKERGYVLESNVVRQLRQHIDHAPAQIGRREFERLVQEGRSGVAGRASDRQLQAWIVEILEDTAPRRVKSRWPWN